MQRDAETEGQGVTSPSNASSGPPSGCELVPAKSLGLVTEQGHYALDLEQRRLKTHSNEPFQRRPVDLILLPRAEAILNRTLPLDRLRNGDAATPPHGVAPRLRDANLSRT